jgi:hypothetical protein
MRVDVYETDRRGAGVRQPEERAEQDGAVPAQHQYELPTTPAIGDWIRELARVVGNVLLVADASGRSFEIAVSIRGFDIAAIARADASDEALVAESGGGEVETPWTVVAIRTDADRRGRAEHNWMDRHSLDSEAESRL